MNNIRMLSVSLVVLAVAGCGGSSTPEPLATTQLQGIWRSPAGAANTMSAVVLPDGKLWAVISNASSTRVIKATFVGQPNGYDGSGKSFILGTAAVNAVSMTASVVEASTLTQTIGSGTQAENYSLVYQTRYATPANLTDFSGSWGASLGTGSVHWILNAAGVISGSSTTGCTYSGALSLRAERKAVVDVAVTENCAGAQTALSGIAVKSEDKTGISVLQTTKDDTAVVALGLAALTL